MIYAVGGFNWSGSVKGRGNINQLSINLKKAISVLIVDSTK